MTQSSHDTFIDRRSDEERDNGLATQILYWYGQGSKKRRQVNGVAMTTDGYLFVARATCSKKDQFVKAHGRMIVSQRMFGNAQKHCWLLILDPSDNLAGIPEAAAAVYAQEFPDDEVGKKRAFNAGNIFVRYRENIQQRADAMLDGFES
jgi:hypothetical protein